MKDWKIVNDKSVPIITNKVDGLAGASVADQPKSLDERIAAVDCNFWWQIGVQEEITNLYSEVVADRERLKAENEFLLSSVYTCNKCGTVMTLSKVSIEKVDKG